MIGILTQKNPDIEDPDIEDLYTIGTVATIMKMVKMVDGSQRIVVQGICRFKLMEFTQKGTALQSARPADLRGIPEGHRDRCDVH